jgi:hypothetical protein
MSIDFGQVTASNNAPRPASILEVHLGALREASRFANRHRDRLQEVCGRLGLPYVDEPSTLKTGVAEAPDSDQMFPQIEAAMKELFVCLDRVGSEIARLEKL